MLSVTGPESMNTSIGNQVEFKCFFHNVPSCLFHIQWNLNGSDVRILSMSKAPNIIQNDSYANEIEMGTLILYLCETQDIKWDNSEIICIGRVLCGVSKSLFSDPALLRIQGTVCVNVHV